MPIKGVIAVFMIAFAITAICWEDFWATISQWLEKYDNNKEE